MRASLFALVLLLTASEVPGQTESPELRAKLDLHVAQYSVSANSLIDVLSYTSERFQVPMGVEWIKQTETLRGLTRTWKDESLRNILRSIVGVYPGYAWRGQNDVVHVFPRGLADDSRNFLNLKVPGFFDVREEVGGLTNQRLLVTVQNIVSPRKLPPGAGEAGTYTGGSVSERAVTLTLRGLSVRETLNKLVEVSEHKVWVVTFSESRALTPTGFRRTETLWHPTPFPDSQQPMWDFLAWSEFPEHCVEEQLKPSAKLPVKRKR